MFAAVVTPGDTRLEVSWSSIGEAGVTTAANITVYYQQSGGGGSTSDSGTELVCKEAGVADAGVNEAGEAGTVLVDAGCSLQPVEGTGGSCSAPGITSSGIDSSMVSSTSVGPTSSQTTITGLQDGVTYAVAVAAQDAFLNNGALTDIVCETPIQLNDFFQTYRNDGGLAGGGCALDVMTGPAGGAATAVITVTALIIMTRRRDDKDRRRARRDDDDDDSKKKDSEKDETKELAE
jgi:hypothetical protein